MELPFSLDFTTSWISENRLIGLLSEMFFELILSLPKLSVLVVLLLLDKLAC